MLLDLILNTGSQENTLTLSQVLLTLILLGLSLEMVSSTWPKVTCFPPSLLSEEFLDMNSPDFVLKGQERDDLVEVCRHSVMRECQSSEQK